MIRSDSNEQGFEPQIVESRARTASTIIGKFECQEREIDLMSESRTPLVPDFVTGKVDVRGVTIPAGPDADAPVAEADAQGLDGPSGDEALDGDPETAEPEEVGA